MDFLWLTEESPLTYKSKRSKNACQDSERNLKEMLVKMAKEKCFQVISYFISLVNRAL